MTMTEIIDEPAMSGLRGREPKDRQYLCQETDAELVRLAGNGCQQAWDELVNRFDSLVFRVARRNGLTAGDAADVAQVTWMRLMVNMDQLRDPARIAGWLVTTARRESVRVAIRASRQVPSADPTAGSRRDIDLRVDPSADADLLREEADFMVSKALRRLPAQYQELLRLLTSDANLSYAEVSSIIGIPIGSIGPMRQRALQLLRRDPELTTEAA